MNLKTESITNDLPRSAAAAASTDRTTGAQKQSPAELQDACKQFEAILVRMILKEAHLERSLVSSEDRANLYGDLLIESLAKSVVDGGGMGIAEILYQQLSQNSAESNPTSPDEPVRGRDERTSAGGK
jgi:flagellar protein FlgJ